MSGLCIIALWLNSVFFLSYFFRYFIAISYDQTSLEIYDFKGSHAAGHLTEYIIGDVLPSAENSEERSTQIRNKMFSLFLQRRHLVRVTGGEEVLNRECSLFTDDSRFVIVGSCHQLPDENGSRFYDVYRNNECITPNYRLIPEDYTLFIIDLKTGTGCRSNSAACHTSLGALLIVLSMAVL